MRIKTIVTEQDICFVLEADTAHEKAFCTVLSEYTGRAKISRETSVHGYSTRADSVRIVLPREDPLPSYHDVVERLCVEFGVPGSPDLGGVIAFLHGRLGEKTSEE